MKDNKLIIKTVLFVGIFILFNTILRAFEPAISAGVAVQQAYDTIGSSAKIKVYTDLKNYSYIGWVAAGLIVYWKDIKKALNIKNVK